MSTLRHARPLIVAVAAVSLLVTACGDDGDVDAGAPERPPAAPPDQAGDYSGELTSVDPFEPITDDCVPPSEGDPDEPVSNDDPPVCTDPATAPLGHVLVEEVPGVQEGQKISLRVVEDTGLFRSVGDEIEAISFSELVEGDVVEAWVDGPVADSYPQQGTAEAILVTT